MIPDKELYDISLIKIFADENKDNLVFKNEDIKILNEDTKISNDDIKISNEDTKILNEDIKISNENTKISHENTKISNEDIKISHEDNLNSIKNDIIFDNLYENITLNNETDNICKNCNKKYSRKDSLRRHILNYCNKKVNENEVINNTNINNNNINNINNIVNNNTLNINLGGTNGNTKIIPFDEDWDLSKIDINMKKSLLFSTIKYTQTMDEIFQNDSNFNVLIKDEKKSGIVYKNEKEKLKEMSINDIVDSSMKKLHKYLKQFYEEIKNDNKYNINIEYLDNELKNVESKYENFKDSENTQKTVKDLMLSIYDKNKDKTCGIYENIIKKENILIENLKGY
jgi:hypothetical protein